MANDRMQTSRFELKYVISEEVAQQIRTYVSAFLDVDENGANKPHFSYQVHSLYIDSDEMKTYWDTINGNKNRFKLRVRYYEDSPDKPAFLEIKRRMNNCIQKQRVGIRREAMPMILNGQLPPPSLMLGHEPRHLLAIQNFCRLIQDLRAKPKMHVAYLREAYLPPTDNTARVTLDRDVRSEPNPAGVLKTTMQNPIQVWGNAVVLELKFTNRYPNWFRDLVCAFNLRQCGAAKYADGFSLLSGRTPQHRHLPQTNGHWQWSSPQTTTEQDVAPLPDQAAEERA
ncbi:MAG TPA: polyphosphate polymerase domain-containing protein [Clostridia bacterium]|nr:polyphosphate polymerase domain-containing protein [Clostridia bacterium]